MKEGEVKRYYLGQKNEVFAIYGEKCPNCGSYTHSCHHIVFRSDFPKGTDYHKIHNKANLVPLCGKCADKLHEKADQKDRS